MIPFLLGQYFHLQTLKKHKGIKTKGKKTAFASLKKKECKKSFLSLLCSLDQRHTHRDAEYINLPAQCIDQLILS